jgi:hypothetical protein
LQQKKSILNFSFSKWLWETFQAALNQQITEGHSIALAKREKQINVTSATESVRWADWRGFERGAI